MSECNPSAHRQQAAVEVALDNDQPVMNINKLPIEVLSRILKRVPPAQRVRVERVCWLWHWLCTKSTLYNPWRDEEHKLVVDCNAAMQEETFALAKRRGPWFRELELKKYSEDVLVQFLDNVVPYCEKVRKLSIDTTLVANIIDWNITPLLRHGFLDNLKCLELFFLDNEVLSLVTERCNRLEYFAFEYLDVPVDQCANEFAKLPALKHLEFDTRKNVYRRDAITHSQREIDTLLQAITHGCVCLQQLFVYETDANEPDSTNHDDESDDDSTNDDDPEPDKDNVNVTFLVDLIRTSKSLSAIVTNRLEEEDADEFCASIAKLFTEEQLYGTQRRWPIDLIFQNQNVLDVSEFPSSEYVNWHQFVWNGGMEVELGKKMLDSICSSRMF